MRETAERAWDNEPEWIWAIEDLITIDMQRLREQVGLLAESAAENNIAALRDVQTWLERLEHHLLGMRRDLRIFAHWPEIEQASGRRRGVQGCRTWGVPD